jgi:anti-sigma factor RsiW
MNRSPSPLDSAVQITESWDAICGREESNSAEWEREREREREREEREREERRRERETERDRKRQRERERSVPPCGTCGHFRVTTKSAGRRDAPHRLMRAPFSNEGRVANANPASMPMALGPAVGVHTVVADPSLHAGACCRRESE